MEVETETKSEDEKFNDRKKNVDINGDKKNESSNGISKEKLNESLKEVIDEINKEQKRKGKRLKIIEVDEYDDVNKENASNLDELKIENILETGNTKDRTEKTAGIDTSARKDEAGHSGKADDKNVEGDDQDPFTEFERKRKQENVIQQKDSLTIQKAQGSGKMNSALTDKGNATENVNKLVSDMEDSENNLDRKESPTDPLIIENESEDLPDEVMKFKDNASRLFKMGRYADAVECYTDAINALNSGMGCLLLF